MSILNVNQIQPVGGGNTITVSASDVNFSGNISIGSSFVGTASTATLATTAILANTATVATNAQGLTGTPDITVNNIQSGVVTATTFIGDGSGITGVTASGSGINIKDNGSTVGVAATVDFGTNLNVSPASAGIVTVTVGDTDFAIADKIVHTGDTNTAIRFPADDIVTVETAGTERLRITSGGNIGINSADPTSYANSQATLVIEDDTNPAICISDTGQARDWWLVGQGNGLTIRYADGGGSSSASNVTSAAFFKNNGNVGIGTDNPSELLHLESGYTKQILKSTNLNTASSLIFDTHNVNTADFLLGQLAGKWNGTDVAYINFEAGADTTNKDDGVITFLTSASGGSPTERLRIRSQGPHLLLGTGGDATYNEITETSSNAGLVIGSSSVGNGGVVIRTGTSGTGRIYFADNSGSDPGRNRGQINYYHNGDYMMFATAGNERLRITSDGKIILKPGVDSGTIVQLNGADTTSEILEAGITSGHVQLTATHASGGSNTCGFIFRTRGSSGGTSEKLRIQSGGNLSITDGNLVVASGHGIDFSSNANASGMTSELLDDYEEGNWTPVIKSGTNTISYTGGQQRFRYMKIGNMVTVTFSLNASTTSGTTGGGFKIEGLPYAARNLTNLRTIGTTVCYYGSGLRASNWPNFIHVGSNNTNIDVYTKTASNSNYDRDTVGAVGASTYFFWQVTYETD